MEPRDSLPARQSIRTRLLLLLLGLTTVSVAIIAYLSVSSILRMGQSTQEASNATLRTQAEEFLVQLTTGAAKQNDLALQRVRQDADSVAEFAASVFEQPHAFANEQYWRAQDQMFVGPEGQYINGEEDASTVFVPNSVTVDSELIQNLEASAYLDLLFAPVYDGNPDTVAIYFISKREFSRLYPNINLGAILPADFVATEDIFFTSGAPESNPTREVVWTPIYDDPAGQGLLVTAVAPVYTGQGEFLGIIGIDVSLAKLSAAIETASPIAGGYSFLVNEQGRAIALPEQGYEDILGRSAEPGEYGALLSGTSPERLRDSTSPFSSILGEMTAGSTGFQSIEVDGRELFVAYAPLSNTNWSLGTVVQAENMLQAVAIFEDKVTASTRELIATRILPAGALILMVVIAVGLFLTNRLVQPVRSLAAAAQAIGAGRWDTSLPPAGNDEIGLLTRTFRTMTAQVRELITSLEARVTERTRDLERRSAYLEASAEVGRAASSILDPDHLIGQAVELIRERFGLYYVGLFLVDAAREWAVLRAGTGEAGQAMLARGHRLRVGGESMIGWSVANALARIAQVAEEDATRLATPELPDTRSEAALPLRSRGQVIGALSVQSDQPGAFDEDTITVLQIMADQVAVAVDNARLFQQAQESLEAERQAYGVMGRQAWERLAREQALQGYYADQRGVFPAKDSWQPEMEQAVQDRQVARADGDSVPAIAIPILVRGQAVGVLDFVKANEDVAWTDEEITMLQGMVDQLGVALDSARLYQETQRRAAQEQLVGEVTARIRETLDVDTILQTAIREMGVALGVPRIEVRMGGGVKSSASGDEQVEKGDDHVVPG